MSLDPIDIAVYINLKHETATKEYNVLVSVNNSEFKNTGTFSLLYAPEKSSIYCLKI